MPSKPRPKIKFCPSCKGDLINVPKDEMKSSRDTETDRTASLNIHIYACHICDLRFEVNQDYKVT